MSGSFDPTCSLHSKKWSEHELGKCLYCAICFKTLTPSTCGKDIRGQQWDLCQSCLDKEDAIKEQQWLDQNERAVESWSKAMEP